MVRWPQRIVLSGESATAAAIHVSRLRTFAVFGSARSEVQHPWAKRVLGGATPDLWGVQRMMDPSCFWQRRCARPVPISSAVFSPCAHWRRAISGSNRDIPAPFLFFTLGSSVRSLVMMPTCFRTWPACHCTLIVARICLLRKSPYSIASRLWSRSSAEVFKSSYWDDKPKECVEHTC